MNFDFGSLTLSTAQRLMNHNTGIRQRKTFAGSTRRQKYGSHGSCHTHADGRNIRFNVLHGVINSHACTYTATGAIDVQMDIFVRIFRFQKEQLSNDNIRHVVIDGSGHKNYSVFEQTRVNVIGTFSAAGLFNDDRNVVHCFSLPLLKTPQVP